MSKAAKLVAGVVVVAGVAWVGTAWYTGTRAEREIRAALDQANAEITMAVPELQVKLGLERFERGIFSSDARYSLTFAVPSSEAESEAEPAAAPAPAEMKTVYMTDHLEHGPFPMSSLKRGNLRPVMASSTFALERNEVVETWFKAAKNQVPLHGNAVLGYGGHVQGQVILSPLDYKEGENSVAFSGMTLDVSGDDRGAGATTASGKIENFQVSGLSDGVPTSVFLTGLDLNSSVDKNLIGENVLTIKSAGLDTGDRKVQVNGYNQRVDLKQDANKVAGSILYEVAQVQLDGRDIASGQFKLNVANIDATALQELTEQYHQAMIRAQAAGNPEEPELSAEQQQAFLDTLGKLLAGNPTISIDPFVVRTGKGESTFTLSVDLTKPQAPEMNIDALIAETVRKLDARLVLNRPMVTDLLTLQYLESGVEPARAATQAQQDVEEMAGMAVQMAVGRAEGDNIVTTLNYADGQIDFNGAKMPVEEFAGQIFGLAMGGGMGGGMDIPMDEEGDAIEEGEEEPLDDAAPEVEGVPPAVAPQ